MSSTASAAGIGLPSISRRRFAAALTVPAALLVPGAMALAATGRDDELLHLEHQWRAATMLAKAEDRNRDEVSRRYDALMPAEPDEIVWRDEDAELFGIDFRAREEILHGKLTGRRFFDGYKTIETLEAVLAELQGLDFPQAASTKVKRGIVRITQILAAHSAWRAKTHTCWHSSGMHAAERSYDAASDRVADLRRRIANEAAASLAGVAVKVRVALECFGDTDEMESGIRELLDEDERGSRETMAYSVLRDLVRLQASSNAMGGAVA